MSGAALSPVFRRVTWYSFHSNASDAGGRLTFPCTSQPPEGAPLWLPEHWQRSPEGVPLRSPEHWHVTTRRCRSQVTTALAVAERNGIRGQNTAVSPRTGNVLWPPPSRRLHKTAGQDVSLEYRRHAKASWSGPARHPAGTAVPLHVKSAPLVQQLPRLAAWLTPVGRPVNCTADRRFRDRSVGVLRLPCGFSR